MSVSRRRRSSKSGLEPGSAVHVGERKTAQTAVSIISYGDGQFEESTSASADDLAGLVGRMPYSWVVVEGLHEASTVEKIGTIFNLHPLTLEDILTTDQRPKADYSGSYVFVVLRDLLPKGNSLRLSSDQVSLVLGKDFVISFQERDTGIFAPVKERLRAGKAPIRAMGPDYLCYALIDCVVDSYFSVLESMEDRIESLEDRIVSQPSPITLRALQSLRKDMITLRKSAWPLREAIGSLQRGGWDLMQPGTLPYLQDVYDHSIQIIDTMETMRDLLSSMLDVYLSSASNRLNEVMKVLTMIATIFMPLTFIAGVYGMNFEHMPELRSEWGYPAVLLLMFLTVVVMLLYFRRKRWL